MPSPAEWVRDGSVSETPVTASTPAIETVETPAPVETPIVAAEVPVETPATPAAVEQAVQDFIDAQLDGKPFQLPRNAAVPLKRGEEVEYVPIAELQKRGMLEKDYRAKTADLAAQRRQMEVQERVNAARIAAMETWQKEQQEFAAKAYQSPEDQARYESFIEQYRGNPAFKQMVDDAAAARVMQAERAAIDEVQGEDALKAEVQELYTAIQRTAEKFPGVDADQVRVAYARDLQTGATHVGVDAIESYFQREAEKRQSILGPVNTELDALKRQIATLSQQLQAQQHNEKTQLQIARATSPVAAPAGGQARDPKPAATQLKGRTLSERSREWGSLRD
jgi:antirestriction protein